MLIKLGIINIIW